MRIAFSISRLINKFCRKLPFRRLVRKAKQTEKKTKLVIFTKIFPNVSFHYRIRGTLVVMKNNSAIKIQFQFSGTNLCLENEMKQIFSNYLDLWQLKYRIEISLGEFLKCKFSRVQYHWEPLCIAIYEHNLRPFSFIFHGRYYVCSTNCNSQVNFGKILLGFWIIEFFSIEKRVRYLCSSLINYMKL